MRANSRMILATLLCSGVVQCACGGDFWSRFTTDYRRNNHWPQPFVAADRMAVRDPFALQTNNGWRMQNTVGDGYFDSTTQELTLAGQLKVKWIVTEAPQARRTVFVMIGNTEDSTMIRVDSVQRAISQFVPKGGLPEVLLTDRDLPGGSGEYYDAVDRAMKSSVPAPRLPSKSAPGGTSGAGGAGSGSGS